MLQPFSLSIQRKSDYQLCAYEIDLDSLHCTGLPCQVISSVLRYFFRFIQNQSDKHAGTVLYCAASSGNPELIKHILALYPENERLNVITGKCSSETALHCATPSGNVECFEIILAQIPESERLQVLNTTGSYGETVLHWATDSMKCLKAALSLFPESQRLEALNKQNRAGWTVLKMMDEETRNTIMEWLSKS